MASTCNVLAMTLGENEQEGAKRQRQREGRKAGAIAGRPGRAASLQCRHQATRRPRPSSLLRRRTLLPQAAAQRGHRQSSSER